MPWPPQKPFASYNWVWASVAPTESLNDPAIFLGVLRAMKQCEGLRKRSREFFDAMRTVETEMRGRHPVAVNLARPPDRNLLRNSGQYWEALGLMEHAQGVIRLTPLGNRIATGQISRREFAVATIKSLRLPNRNIHTDWSDWERADLEIRPLELILSVLTRLEESYGRERAHLSVGELVRIVVPLAGSEASVDEHCRALREFRAGNLDLGDWPDCAPRANDVRMAAEFLLFLEHHGFLNRIAEGDDREANVYALAENADEDWEELEGLESGEAETMIERVRASRVGLFGERDRTFVQQWSRPGQREFRRDVLQGFNSCCLLTGEAIPDVLEAAHIIPVRYSGGDTPSNGLCLRSDIHTLFDGGHIRIASDGRVTLSELAGRSPIYSGLAPQVTIPDFVAAEALNWRWTYN